MLSRNFETSIKSRLVLNEQDILIYRRTSEEKIGFDYDAIVLPQLYQAEVIFKTHDQEAHQGVNKVTARIQQRFIWPGMHSTIKKEIKSCHVCQNQKGKAKIEKFPLKNIVTSYFNELVQIDHQKICKTESGYTGILVMIDHYLKLAEAIP